MKVGELMCNDVGFVTVGDCANEAARVLWECDCGIVPVVDASGARKLAGVITDRDICMAAYTQGKTLAEIPVPSAMARDVLTCSPEDPIARVEERMRSAQVRRLPVVDSTRRLVGMLSLADIAREAGKAGRPQRAGGVDPREVGDTLASITQPHPATAS
jgi:CBS-domain-containing membrane protein